MCYNFNKNTENVYFVIIIYTDSICKIKTINILSQISLLKYKRKEYNDEEIILGIIRNDNNVVDFVYRKYLTIIRKMVFTFRNTVLDPEEIFQEGLTRAIINIQEGKFKRESAFGTYLNSICRNICLKQLSNICRGENIINDIEDEDNTDRLELLEAVSVIRDSINKKCKKIIDLRFNMGDIPGHKTDNNLLPFDDIARVLNISSDNARQRFRRCLDTLRKLLQNDEVIKRLF